MSLIIRTEYKGLTVQLRCDSYIDWCLPERGLPLRTTVILFRVSGTVNNGSGYPPGEGSGGIDAGIVSEAFRDWSLAARAREGFEY